MRGIKNTHLKTTIWSLFGRYLPNLIQIASTLLIARLILPSDFGEIAIITTFTQIASLVVSSGFYEALIYKSKNSQRLYSTVFFSNILIAFLLYILLFLFSSAIADFYSIPRLGVLTKIVSLNIVIYAFSYIQRTIYTIKLDFKTPALISLVASIVGSGIGLLMAFNHYEVWAVVCQTLLINLLQSVLFWKLSAWRPRLTFSYGELKTILPYSSKILLNNFVSVFYDNIYSLVLGKAFSSKILGYYNRMQTVVFFTTTNFMYAVESVFFPTLCGRKNNADYMVTSYETLLRLSTFLTFPILIVMIALGKPIILILLTEKWLGALEILKLVSFAYLFLPIIYINNSFLKIANKPNVLFYTNIIRKIIGVFILFLTIPYNITTVCYGMILYYFTDAFISMICTHIFIKINIFRQVRFILSNVVLNTVFFFVIKYISSLFSSDFMKIFSGIAIAGLSYLLLSMLCRSKEYGLLKKYVM